MIPMEKCRFEELVKDNKKTIYLKGAIDEDTNFTPLLKNTDSMFLNLSGITAINSCGIRSWVNFLKDVGSAKITYEECPPLIVRQMNMVPSFLGKSRVASVFVPYICDGCDHENIVLVSEDQFKGGNVTVPEVKPCENCKKGDMEFDGSPKQYFAFCK